MSRSILIDDTSENVHEYVDDLRKWGEWGPWKEGDSTLTTTYGTKTSGVVASQSWTGKDGDGSLEITESSPDRRIGYDLWFDQGKYQCKSSILYESQPDNGTKVTRSMDGDTKTPVIGGYFAVLMDSMIESSRGRVLPTKVFKLQLSMQRN